jgi:LmbE family N-acetylglucosaminyl deacetylase
VTEKAHQKIPKKWPNRKTKDAPMDDFEFCNAGAELYIPDALPQKQALARCTRLGIGAHQDDLEIMAYAPILECYGRDDQWFCGVTTGDGLGGVRGSKYRAYTDAQMAELRRAEQRKASSIGNYGAQFQLNYSSAQVKDVADKSVIEDYLHILERCSATEVYTHNLADKHDTHVAVALKVIAAIRRLPRIQRPKRLIGCEVWRALDWLEDSEKVIMNVDGNEVLAEALLQAFESQNSSKRYDLAVPARRKANASFLESHAADTATSIIFGMDLSPLIDDDTISPQHFCANFVKHFETDLKTRLCKLSK